MAKQVYQTVKEFDEAALHRAEGALNLTIERGIVAGAFTPSDRPTFGDPAKSRATRIRWCNRLYTNLREIQVWSEIVAHHEVQA